MFWRGVWGYLPANIVQGVVGFLTMEDVLEVLVGDIQDEHHKAERGVLKETIIGGEFH